MIHECDQPSLRSIAFKLFPASLPHRPGMSLFTPDMLSLLPLFPVDLHQAVVQHDPIESVMRNMNPVHFPTFLLQKGRSDVVALIGFEDHLFLACIDWLWLSPKSPKHRIVPTSFELGDELIHSLGGNREMPNNHYNGLFFYPLPNDSLDIPIR